MVVRALVAVIGTEGVCYEQSMEIVLVQKLSKIGPELDFGIFGTIASRVSPEAWRNVTRRVGNERVEDYALLVWIHLSV